MTQQQQHPSAAVARFAATLDFDAIPAPVVRRAEDLFLDWFACALAGKQARPVETIARFIEAMGPGDGPSEILIPQAQQPAVRGAGQRRGVAFRRAGRLAQQLGVASGNSVFPAALARRRRSAAAGAS